MHGMLVAELILTQERESTSFTESEGASEATEGEGRCQIYWGQHPVFAELHSTMVKPDRRATNGPQAHMPQTRRKKLQNTHLIKDCYLTFTKDS